MYVALVRLKRILRRFLFSPLCFARRRPYSRTIYVHIHVHTQYDIIFTINNNYCVGLRNRRAASAAAIYNETVGPCTYDGEIIDVFSPPSFFMHYVHRRRDRHRYR